MRLPCARDRTRGRSRPYACLLASICAYVGGQTHAFKDTNLRNYPYFSKLFYTKIRWALRSWLRLFRVVTLYRETTRLAASTGASDVPICFISSIVLTNYLRVVFSQQMTHDNTDFARALLVPAIRMKTLEVIYMRQKNSAREKYITNL